MSDFIPNSFQTPNIYIDKAMHLLTPNEYMVLSYAVRRIFGFNKRQDRISLSQFTDGIIGHDGNHLDHGTGLCISTVRDALKSLIGYRLIAKVSENDPGKNEGPLYELQLSSGDVDWAGLEKRAKEKAANNFDRMSKARKARAEPPTMGQTPYNGTEDPPYNGTEAPPYNGTETQNTVEIQSKSSSSATSAEAQKPSIKNGNGKTSRRPSRKDVALSELENEFSRVSNIALPPRQTAKQKKAAAARWWNPLWQIYQVSNCDTERASALMRQAIIQMRKGGMTVSAPASIESVVTSIAASQKSSENVGNVYV